MVGESGPRNASTGAAAGVQVEGTRVLVIDDEPDLCALLKLHLVFESSVAEVRTAGSGEDALSICSDFSPDVVVLDRRLPGELEGGELAARLREVVQPSPRIISFTGLDTPDDWSDVQIVKSSGTAVQRVVKAVVDAPHH